VVGDPSKRFREDGLRVLRGCRFASQLGFSIERNTLATMISHKMMLQQVSAERITHELDALLLGDFVHDALMETIDVIGAIMPEIVACKGFDQHTPYHIYDVWEHIAWVVQRAPATRLARWAALFHDIGKPAALFMDGERGHFFGHARLSAILARDVMNRLLMSTSFIERVVKLVLIHDNQIAATSRSVRKALGRLDGDVEMFRTLIGIKRADALAQSHLSQPRIDLSYELDTVLDEIIAQGEAFTVRQLAINGRDVLALGVEAGPIVGNVLNAALDAVIDGRVANEPEALLQYVATLV
jgi:tRNA nucleotidyltransferase (CCA-adding enzyme)